MANHPHERGDAPFGDGGEPRRSPWEHGGGAQGPSQESWDDGQGPWNQAQGPWDQGQGPWDQGQGPWDRGPEGGHGHGHGNSHAHGFGSGDGHGAGLGGAHDPYAATDGHSDDIFDPIENDGTFASNHYRDAGSGGAHTIPPYAAGPQPHGTIPSSAAGTPQKSNTALWIALAACLAIIIGLGVLLLVNNDDPGTTAGGETSASTRDTGTTDGGESVPGEYLQALEQAEFLANEMHQSRNRVHQSLTSPYGDQYSEDAADYAIDNVDADWRENALESARSYQRHLDMTPDEIYDQLIPPYGEDFTDDEAQYAVDNL